MHSGPGLPSAACVQPRAIGRGWNRVQPGAAPVALTAKTRIANRIPSCNQAGRSGSRLPLMTSGVAPGRATLVPHWAARYGDSRWLWHITPSGPAATSEQLSSMCISRTSKLGSCACDPRAIRCRPPTTTHGPHRSFARLSPVPETGLEAGNGSRTAHTTQRLPTASGGALRLRDGRQWSRALVVGGAVADHLPAIDPEQAEQAGPRE